MEMSRFSGRSLGFSENAERRPALSVGPSFEEILSGLMLPNPSGEETAPVKSLLWGDEAGALASLVAGGMALKGFGVIVLDGANCFDPYKVSLIARKASIPPEKVLKSIRVARAFTAYQMETLIVEKLPRLLEKTSERSWVVLLGVATPFGDEDLSDREVGPLFERVLKKVKELSSTKGISLLFFQPFLCSTGRRGYLMKRLFSFSDRVWKMTIDPEGPKWVLQKGWGQRMGGSKSPFLPFKARPTECVHG